MKELEYERKVGYLDEKGRIKVPIGSQIAKEEVEVVQSSLEGPVSRRIRVTAYCPVDEEQKPEPKKR